MRVRAALHGWSGRVTPVTFREPYIPFLGPVAPPCRRSPSDYLIQRVNRTLNGLLSAAQPRIRRVDLCAEILEEERP